VQVLITLARAGIASLHPSEKEATAQNVMHGSEQARHQAGAAHVRIMIQHGMTGAALPGRRPSVARQVFALEGLEQHRATRSIQHAAQHDVALRIQIGALRRRQRRVRYAGAGQRVLDRRRSH
jgi:hypothetical protein